MRWWRRWESNPRPKPRNVGYYVRIPGILPHAGPRGLPSDWGDGGFEGLFIVPGHHATEWIGTIQDKTRPNLEPWHSQAGRLYRCLGGESEVLVVVGTCSVFPVFYEVPRTSARNLDPIRSRRNRCAPMSRRSVTRPALPRTEPAGAPLAAPNVHPPEADVNPAAVLALRCALPPPLPPHR